MDTLGERVRHRCASRRGIEIRHEPRPHRQRAGRAGEAGRPVVVVADPDDRRRASPRIRRTSCPATPTRYRTCPPRRRFGGSTLRAARPVPCSITSFEHPIQLQNGVRLRHLRDFERERAQRLAFIADHRANRTQLRAEAAAREAAVDLRRLRAAKHRPRPASSPALRAACA